MAAGGPSGSAFLKSRSKDEVKSQQDSQEQHDELPGLLLQGGVDKLAHTLGVDLELGLGRLLFLLQVQLFFTSFLRLLCSFLGELKLEHAYLILIILNLTHK